MSAELREIRSERMEAATAPAERLVREAFDGAGEKRWQLSKWLFRRFLGPDWSYGFLGFAYLKHVDNAADAELDQATALAFLASQRALVERLYAGEADAAGAGLERYLAEFARYDRRAGAPLRAQIESVLDVIEHDVRRRGRLLGEAELEAWAAGAGRAMIVCLAHFAAPQVELPERYCAEASCAYMLADTVVDLEEDLRIGVINVPAEAVARYGMRLDASDPALAAWALDHAPRVLWHFEEALRETKRVRSLALRLMTYLLLLRKRQQMRRFIERRLRPQAGARRAT